MLTVYESSTGLPMTCDTCGAPANFVWYGNLGRQVQALLRGA